MRVLAGRGSAVLGEAWNSASLGTAELGGAVLREAWNVARKGAAEQGAAW